MGLTLKLYTYTKPKKPTTITTTTTRGVFLKKIFLESFLLCICDTHLCCTCQMLNLVQKAKALLPLLLFGGAGQVCWAIKSTCWIFGTKFKPMGEQKGVCALPFTLKKVKYLKAKKSIIGNSNISSCQNNNLQNNPQKETKIL